MRRGSTGPCAIHVQRRARRVGLQGGREREPAPLVRRPDVERPSVLLDGLAVLPRRREPGEQHREAGAPQERLDLVERHPEESALQIGRVDAAMVKLPVQRGLRQAGFSKVFWDLCPSFQLTGYFLCIHYQNQLRGSEASVFLLFQRRF